LRSTIITKSAFFSGIGPNFFEWYWCRYV